MWRDRPPPGRGVGNGHHQQDPSTKTLRESDPLELSRAQLRLEVARGALDFDQDRLVRSSEDHVGGATVGREGNWDLQANLPRLMCGGPDLLCQRQLSRVAQSDPVHGEEPD
jgi:hypothetical protein